MLILTREDLEDILDMRVVIDAVERGLVEQARGTVTMPLRIALDIDGTGAHYAMPAYLAGMRALAVKLVSDFPANVNRGIPSVTGAVILLNGETGEPLSLMDGGYITSMRTGAASALATRCLALVDAQVLGIIGTGTQARTQVLGIWTVRDIQLVKAFSRSRDNVRRFCREIAEKLEVEALVADRAEDVVRDSDVVVTATNADSPVLRGEWLEPGLHVNSIGGGRSRELDSETYRRSRVVVDTMEGVLAGANDLRAAIADGIFSESSIYAELCELVAGMKKGRVSKDEITLFRSVGMALEDAAVAYVAYEMATEAGVGIEVSI